MIQFILPSPAKEYCTLLFFAAKPDHAFVDGKKQMLHNIKTFAQPLPQIEHLLV